MSESPKATLNKILMSQVEILIKRFINGSTSTSRFLNQIALIKGPENEGTTFTSIHDAIKHTLSNHSSQQFNIRFTIGCLAGIKGLYFNPNILKYSQFVKASKKTKLSNQMELTPANKILIKQGLASFLSPDYSIKHLEDLFKRNTYPDPNDILSDPQLDLTISQEVNSEFLPIPIVRGDIDELTLHCFKTFPFLIQISLPKSIFRKHIEALYSKKLIKNIIKWFIFYPEYLTMDDYDRLAIETVYHEEFIKILLCIKYLQYPRVDEIKLPQIGLYEFPKTWSFMKRRIADLEEDELKDCVIKISDSELNNIANRFLSENIDMDRSKNFTGYKEIMSHFHILHTTKEKIESVLKVIKYSKFIHPSKWRIAVSLGYQKEKLALIFQGLMLKEYYLEAQYLYEISNLQEFVPPVSADLLEKGRQKVILYPHQSAKVVFVNNLETVNYMRSVFGYDSPADLPANKIIPGKHVSNVLNFKSLQAKFNNRTSNDPLYREYVGLDTEWKNNIKPNTTIEEESMSTKSVNNDIENLDELKSPTKSEKESGVDLFQISTSTHTFLVDMYTLDQDPYSTDEFHRHAIEVIGNMLVDPTLLKIGFDFQNSDIKMLRQNFRGRLNFYLENMDQVLDLQDNSEKLSLSKLVERYFNKKLLKVQQLSDWQARPLSQEQMDYGSLDAHILVALVDFVMGMNNIELNINVAKGMYGFENDGNSINALTPSLIPPSPSENSSIFSELTTMTNRSTKSTF